VLLAGDAGKFTTSDGVGSWPAMASGVAAARAVRHACQKGDFSKAGLAVYADFLSDEGLLATQRAARESWLYDRAHREVLARRPGHLVRIARRYFDQKEREQFGSASVEGEEHRLSLWGDVYHSLVRPVAPWYVRWALDLAAWVDTRRWHRRQARA
jgi:flavin-dependent dehydrogenase